MLFLGCIFGLKFAFYFSVAVEDGDHSYTVCVDAFIGKPKNFLKTLDWKKNSSFKFLFSELLCYIIDFC